MSWSRRATSFTPASPTTLGEWTLSFRTPFYRVLKTKFRTPLPLYKDTVNVPNVPLIQRFPCLQSSQHVACCGVWRLTQTHQPVYCRTECVLAALELAYNDVCVCVCGRGRGAAASLGTRGLSGRLAEHYVGTPPLGQFPYQRFSDTECLISFPCRVGCL